MSLHVSQRQLNCYRFVAYFRSPPGKNIWLYFKSFLCF